MSQLNDDIDQIEISMEEARKLVDRRDRIHRLYSNRDFRAVIIDGYFKDEALRLISAFGSSNPALVNSRGEIALEMQAITKVKEYLDTAVRIGDAAASEILEHERELVDLRNEAAEEM